MRTILFVDDEPAVLEGMREGLRRYRGASAMAFAASGTAALTLLASRRFDAVVSDMRMPGMDGPALLTAVRDIHPQTLRIVLSGYSGPEAVVRAASVAHQFFAKPCGVSELMATIDRGCRWRDSLGDDTLMRAVTATSTLPSAPSIHRRIDDAIADPAATARDLGAILAEDPALGAKVLQLANSSMFHSGPGVTSVSKAASYLGVNTLKLLARSGCTFPLDPRCSPAGFSIERFQRHSLLVAHIAQRIADEAHLPCDAFTAGLLHDVGKLVAAARSLPAASKHSASHAAAGACLLGLWGLPDALVEAVAHHHDPEQISSRGLTGAAVIHVADALAHELAPVPGEHGPAINGDYLASIGVADRVPAWRALAAA